MVRVALDLTGKQFGRLTVITRVHVRGLGTSWLCKCKCGNEVRVRGTNLVAGNTKSCGCAKKRDNHYERTRPRRGDTKLSWELMLNRCLNTKCDKYPDYGGVGITVDPRWYEYDNFLADMGERPPGMTIDRYPNCYGNYEPGNCRWATAKEQANNRRDNVRLTIFGREQTMRQWAEEYKIPSGTLAGRLKRGMTPEQALTTPIYGTLSSPEMRAKFYRNRKSNWFIEAFGKRQTLVAWAEEYGIKPAVLSARIRCRGLTPEEAMTTPIIPRGQRHKGMKGG